MPRTSLATSGTVTLSGSVNASSIALNATGYTVQNGTLTLPTGGTSVTVASGVSATVSSIVAGSILTVGGGGTLTLSGTNTYSGGTTVTAGTLSISKDASLGAATGGLTLNGGALEVTGTSDTGLGSSRSLAIGSSGATIDINASAENYAIGQSIATTTGGLTKTGSGALALDAANSYSGGTTLSAGTLILGAAVALGTGVFSLDGGTLQASTDLSGANAVTNATTLFGSCTISGSDNITFAGSLSYGGNYTLTNNVGSGRSLCWPERSICQIPAPTPRHISPVPVRRSLPEQSPTTAAHKFLGAQQQRHRHRGTQWHQHQLLFQFLPGGRHPHRGRVGHVESGGHERFHPGGSTLEASVDLSGSNAISAASQITNGNATVGGSYNITISGTFAGNASYTLTNDLASGTQLLLAGNVTLANGTSNNNQTLTFAGSGITEITGRILNGNTSGYTSGISLVGGTLIFDHSGAANNYEGATTISTGALLECEANNQMNSMPWSSMAERLTCTAPTSRWQVFQARGARSATTAAGVPAHSR